MIAFSTAHRVPHEAPLQMPGPFALLFTMAMGASRCASQNHWFTDVVGSICLGWLLMHWIPCPLYLALPNDTADSPGSRLPTSFIPSGIR